MNLSTLRMRGGASRLLTGGNGAGSEAQQARRKYKQELIDYRHWR